MDKQQIITQASLDSLKAQLDELKAQREIIKKDISTARSYGDLSENSEYDEAKNEQAKNAMQIAELEERIKNAHVVDESEIDHNLIHVGSIVVVYNEKKKKEITYHIVDSYGADPLAGKISDVSPIGRALVGAKSGERVVAELPSGEQVGLKVRKITRAQ
ncbi:MAG: transcription elongation factor GreA [Clostridia bacterium]|nr:transcription elongation factor GreA [Clostridia bacterium]MBP5427937.1 transcription elongation factor GreA [Clostridia bacterium]